MPKKENSKKHSGIEALTGKSNFDIAESIIARLLNEFVKYNCTIAMLCKTTVAKNILQDIKRCGFKISFMDMYVFDANEIFNVNCEAGLIIMKLGENVGSVCNVYDFNTNKKLRQLLRRHWK